MVAVARCQVNLQRITAIPADDVTNTWHFKDSAQGSVTVGDATDLAAALVQFYEDANSWWSEALTGAITVKVYDLNDAKPREPVYEVLDSFTAPTNNGLPSEVALCLSFQAAAASGSPIARRRGRVFLGPLQVATLGTTAADGEVRPTNAALAAFDTFYSDLRTAVAGIGSYAHCVYSPTSDESSSLDGSTHVVSEVWMDDSFDIQRRRGSDPTSRRVILP